MHTRPVGKLSHHQNNMCHTYILSNNTVYDSAFQIVVSKTVNNKIRPAKVFIHKREFEASWWSGIKKKVRLNERSSKGGSGGCPNAIDTI